MRLIDADLLLEKRFEDGMIDGNELLVPYNDVVNAIRQAPTVAAVELVWNEAVMSLLAQYMMQFAMEEIREHRRKIGHDPVWWPDEELLLEWYDKALYYVKSVVENEQNEENSK